jgi:hypothetical protein
MSEQRLHTRRSSVGAHTAREARQQKKVLPASKMLGGTVKAKADLAGDIAGWCCGGGGGGLDMVIVRDSSTHLRLKKICEIKFCRKLRRDSYVCT